MSGNQRFKSNLKVKKHFCKRFVRLKQAERRSRFLKNEPSFTFFKKSAEQRPEWKLHPARSAARSGSKSNSGPFACFGIIFIKIVIKNAEIY
ncbi:MAG: hypothetical protein IJM24_07950 [Clostridia bacterium]|nr:hypothetical protein [Clostridia bacterium]